MPRKRTALATTGGENRVKEGAMKSSGLGFLLAISLLACGGSKSDNNGSPDGSAGHETDGGTSSADGGADTAAPVTCPSTPASDDLRVKRDACTFAAGARVADTIGLSEEARKNIPIKHVIVLMKENRSF